jgi:hypothetical protein
MADKLIGVRFLSSLALFLAACGSTSSTASGDGPLVACNPFSGYEKPITLGTVLGAGRSAAGDIYVADHVDTGDRLFKSHDTRLIRQRLAGTGGGSGVYVFTVTEAEPPYELQIETGPSGPAAMGLLTSTIDGKAFEIGQTGETLELVSASALASFTLQNFPPEVFLEYNAKTADDRFLVVVRPKDEWTYEDFRVFFGPTGAVAQRRVASVSRARDGGSTTISFEVAGTAATASFPVTFNGQTFEPGPATLTVGSDSQSLTRLPTDTTPLDHAYLCMQNR